MKKLLFILFLHLFFSSQFSFAQPGSLDNTFGTGGKVTTDFGAYDEGYSVAIQSDGKIVIAGYTNKFNNNIGYIVDFALVRYNTDGTLDAAFGTGGKVTTDFGGADYSVSVALQIDGKIVVAGHSINSSYNFDFALARYNSNGSLDSSFGSGGKITTDFGGAKESGISVAIQTDGKIVLAGMSDYDFVLVRYNGNGSLDNTFSSDGKVTTDFGGSDDYGYSVAIQSDGKIVVAGLGNTGLGHCVFALVRYNNDGTYDNTFDTDGKVTTDFVGSNYGSYYSYGRSVVIQSDDKIVVAGQLKNGGNQDFALARYNSNGTLDSNFGSGGKVNTDFGSSGDLCKSVAIQSDGKIVVAGHSLNASNNSKFALVRYNSNGSLDNSFGSGGKVLTAFGSIPSDYGYSVAIQIDGKIVVAGFNGNISDHDFAVARYIGCSESSPLAKSPCDSSAVDIVENTEVNDVSIYPNPTTGIFSVNLKTKTADKKICVYDILGNCVLNKIYENGVSPKINLSNQPKGIYFLEIVSEDERIARKIIIE